MSMTTQAEANLLKLIFQNIAWANIGNAGGLLPSSVAGNLYVSLHNADPDEGGDQSSDETTYVGYDRMPVARSSGAWDVTEEVEPNPAQAVNVASVQFPECTAGPDQTVTHFGIGTAASGAGHLLYSGELDTPLVVEAGRAPFFAAGSLKFTQE